MLKLILGIALFLFTATSTFALDLDNPLIQKILILTLKYKQAKQSYNNSEQLLKEANIYIENEIDTYFNNLLTNEKLSKLLCDIINSHSGETQNSTDSIIDSYSWYILSRILFREPKNAYIWINKYYSHFSDNGRSLIFRMLNPDYIQTWDLWYLLLDDLNSRKSLGYSIKNSSDIYDRMSRQLAKSDHPLHSTLPEKCQYSYGTMSTGRKTAIPLFKVWYQKYKDVYLSDKIKLHGIDMEMKELSKKIQTTIQNQKELKEKSKSTKNSNKDK